MAIQPPSDIILDVAKAADPVRAQAAAQKLAKLAGTGAAGFSQGGFSQGSFSQVMDAARVGAAATTGSAADIVNLRQTMPGVAAADGKTNPYKGLEAAIWQNLVEDMLPKNEGFFGDSAGGGITRSLLAEQLGKQLAKTSTLGIAEQALRQHPVKGSAAGAGGAHPTAIDPTAVKRG